MLYIDQTVRKYLEDLGAKTPAPGGGSVAAFQGSLGCGLLLMVANYTKGKEKYKEFEKDIVKAIDSLNKIKTELSDLIDKDVQAYTKLSEAYKTKDKQSIQSALKEALQVPLNISKAASSGLAIAEEMEKKGNVNLITDVAIAAILLDGAFYSGKLNVDINIVQIEDLTFKREVSRLMTKLEKGIEDKKDKILRKVEEILRKGG